MKPVVGLFQAALIDVRVDLRRGNVRMTQDCLYGSQIGAIFYHVRGAAVAQHVWTGFASCGA